MRAHQTNDSGHLQPLAEAGDWDAFWRKASARQSISWSKRRIMKILDPYLKKNAVVMDAGCGSGFFSSWFLQKGCRVWSVDYSKEALQRTSDLTCGKTTCIQMDLLNDALTDHMDGQSFDLIFTDGLLEHFKPKQQDLILRNFKTILKDDGILAMFAPNKYSPWQLIRPFYMTGIEEKPFTLKEFISLHQRNNLAILKAGGINVLPFGMSPERLGSWFGMILYVVSKPLNNNGF